MAWEDDFRGREMSLPVDASPDDRIAGRMDDGTRVYVTARGTQYYASPIQNALATPATFGERAWNVLSGIPKSLVQSAVNGFTAPGRALRGEPVTMGDVYDTAGLVSLGAAAMPKGALRSANQSENLASRTANLYDLPTKSEVGDVLGRPGSGGFDLEGRPLVARHVVGRTPDSQIERAINPQVLNEVSERFAGGPIEAVPKAALPRGSVGAVDVDRFRPGLPSKVRVWNGLGPVAFGRASGHEVGHVIDDVAGRIPVEGLSAELKSLYHYGVVEGPHKPYLGDKGLLRDRNFSGPQHLGYARDDIPREYMAEALRQYMVAPDTMKARFPKTAARIREFVNARPNIMEVIQFNSLVAGGAGLAGMAVPQFSEDETRNYLAQFR